MAKIEIRSAFVEEQVGNPTFVLKIAEPHSRQDDQGNWQTVARTFFDVKVKKDSGIDLSRFAKGARVKISGSQRTEVREHQGKKHYTLVIWADSIEQADAGSSQGGGFGGGSGQGQGEWAQPPANDAQAGAQGFGGGFESEPF